MNWYALSKTTGVATLCASERDARREAKAYDNLYPGAAPHVATRLQPVDADDGLDVAQELRSVMEWEKKRMGAVSAGVLHSVIARLESMTANA